MSAQRVDLGAYFAAASAGVSPERAYALAVHSLPVGIAHEPVRARWRLWLALGLLLALLAGGGAWTLQGGDTAAHQPRVTEDSPQWNCRTMGNRICGEGVRP